MDLTLRLATRNDIFPIMALYQKLGSTYSEDLLFLDFDRMANAMEPAKNLWLVSGEGMNLEFVSHVQIDREEGLARLSRLVVDPDRDQLTSLRHGIRSTLEFLRKTEPRIELVYSTTFTLAPQFQHASLEEGFKIMGVFPSARGIDRSRLNGLTVYYMDGVLQNKRVSDIVLHPLVAPFYRIAQQQSGLPNAAQATEVNVAQDFDKIETLEIIRAPQLVQKRFERLKSQQSIAAHFYPFYNPDTLICDPEMSCEIYVKLWDTTRFAAIIGEHLKRAVDPALLYSKAQELLKQAGVSYIEVINDAADLAGTDSIIRSGFTPTGYIPAFKRFGDKRRDYVVYGKSFEYVCKPNMNVAQGYIDFFRQYYRLERRNYISSI